MQEVVDGITEKLVRRHPHIFGDVQARDAGEALLSWEAQKRLEKPERTSLLDGVPKDLPALMSAEKLQKKAAKAGFDWDDIAPVWDKLAEELAELKEAVQSGEAAKIEDELGDVVFAVVNLGRFLGVEAEVALNGTNNKFIRRFQHMEAALRERGRKWQELDLAQMEQLWQDAKDQE